MILTTYHEAGAFLRKTQAVLERNEAINGLTLATCLRLRQFADPSASEAVFVVIEDDQGVAATATYVPPRQVLLTCEYCDAAVLNLLAQAIALFSPNVPGVIAPADAAYLFAQQWTDVTRQSTQLLLCQRLYTLNHVAYLPDVAGSMRLATQVDLDLVAEWISAFQSEMLQPVPQHVARAVAERRVRQQQIYLWEDDVPVTMAGQARPTRNGITVDAVYAPPQRRGKGYTAACIAQLSQHLLRAGWHWCMLFTDAANPAANAMYQRIGYQPQLDFHVYRFA